MERTRDQIMNELKKRSLHNIRTTSEVILGGIMLVLEDIEKELRA